MWQDRVSLGLCITKSSGHFGTHCMGVLAVIGAVVPASLILCPPQHAYWFCSCFPGFFPQGLLFLVNPENGLATMTAIPALWDTAKSSAEVTGFSCWVWRRGAVCFSQCGDAFSADICLPVRL
jgi:hypothetical protein